MNQEEVVDLKAVSVTAGLRLFLCGDVMTGRGIDQLMPHALDPHIYEPYVKDARDYVRLAESVNGPVLQPVPYDYIWGDALQVWRQMAPDLKLINLETSITTHQEPWPGKPIQYRMHPAHVQVLLEAGIDCCSLANNHVLDWQHPGLQETLETLEQAGIAYAGAGRNEQEACRPAFLTTPKGRVLVLATGFPASGIPVEWTATAGQAGVNFLPDLSRENLELISMQVQAVKQPGDVVVFSVHWGGNWGYAVPARQQNFARQLIDAAGVDLVHGHSAHHPLGLEVYKGKLIIYGAGDFVNDYEGIAGYEQYRADLSLMYFAELAPASGQLMSLRMVPMQLRRLRLQHASAADAEWLTRVLDRESRAFGTQISLQQDGSLALAGI